MKNLKINWKTTLAGAIILATFVGHVLFPLVVTTAVNDGIFAVAGSFGLLTAKDGDVTGIGADATTIASQALPVLSSLTSHSTNPTMQDVHQVIDKLSGAFVQAAQANAAATPAPVVVTAPAAAPAVSEVQAPVINNVVEAQPAPEQAPAVDTNSSAFQQAVDAAVAAKLAEKQSAV